MDIEYLERHCNAWTHYIGAIFALVAFIFLIFRGIEFHSTPYLISVILFSLSLLFLYSISGTYHILHPSKAKNIFQILDHIGIYFLIASSYTPYIFIIFSGPKKWLLFSIQWGFTLFGILFKIFYTGKLQLLSTLLYLVMGWSILFFFADVKEFLSPLSFQFLVLSGLSYSIGVIPFLLEKIRFTHALWHIFVLLGSFFGFLSIFYIFP